MTWTGDLKLELSFRCIEQCDKVKLRLFRRYMPSTRLVLKCLVTG